MKSRMFMVLLVLAVFSGCGGNGAAAPVEDLSQGDVARFNQCLDDSSCLFLGNVETTPPDPGLPAGLRAYGGRWEGYQLGTPTKDDIFLVVVFTEITEREATAVLGMGQNPAKPMILERRRFSVAAAGGGYEIQSTSTVAGVGSDEVISVRLVFRLDAGKERLVHRAEKVDDPRAYSEFVLTRNRHITVVRDMAGYLRRHRIEVVRHDDPRLAAVSSGYLVYLPETGSDGGPRPLIIFYHGTGEIGDDPTIISKSSPFRYILDKGDLPCLIAAPQLAAGRREFTEEFFDRFLKEITARYPVDPARVTVTGLSLGGYAVWRFAGSHPEKIAAFAPLSVSVPRLADYIRPAAAAGLRGKPVWIINGAEDTIFPVASARATAEEARRAGMAVRYTEIADADHDTWTKTYADRAFFDWLLAQEAK